MRQALPAASHDVGLVRCDARCRAASPFVAALAAALAAAPLTTTPFSALSAALATLHAAAAFLRHLRARHAARRRACMHHLQREWYTHLARRVQQRRWHQKQSLRVGRWPNVPANRVPQRRLPTLIEHSGVHYNCDVKAMGSANGGGYGVPRAACCNCGEKDDPLKATRARMFTLEENSAYTCYYSCHVCQVVPPSPPCRNSPPAPPAPPSLPPAPSAVGAIVGGIAGALVVLLAVGACIWKREPLKEWYQKHAPTAPSLPSMPSMPKMPSMPSMPKMPSLPSMPSMPKMPSMPSLPSEPSISTVQVEEKEEEKKEENEEGASLMCRALHAVFEFFF